VNSPERHRVGSQHFHPVAGSGCPGKGRGIDAVLERDDELARGWGRRHRSTSCGRDDGSRCDHHRRQRPCQLVSDAGRAAPLEPQPCERPPMRPLLPSDGDCAWPTAGSSLAGLELSPEVSPARSRRLVVDDTADVVGHLGATNPGHLGREGRPWRPAPSSGVAPHLHCRHPRQRRHLTGLEDTTGTGSLAWQRPTGELPAADEQHRWELECRRACHATPTNASILQILSAREGLYGVRPVE
jgi:hypothetical protein